MQKSTLLLGMTAALLLFAGGPATLAQEHGAAPTPSTHKPDPTPAAGETANGHADEHGSPNLFAGDLGNAIWTTIIFLIVVIILGKSAWPPLLKALNEREKLIRESIESAKRDRDEANKLMADYKAQLEKARVEATAIVDEGRRDAQAVRQRTQDEARKEADEIVSRARREVQLAAESAIKAIYDEAAQLAVDVAAQVVRKQFKADEQRQLVSESIAKMKAARQASLMN